MKIEKWTFSKISPAESRRRTRPDRVVGEETVGIDIGLLVAERLLPERHILILSLRLRRGVGLMP